MFVHYLRGLGLYTHIRVIVLSVRIGKEAEPISPAMRHRFLQEGCFGLPGKPDFDLERSLNTHLPLEVPVPPAPATGVPAAAASMVT